MCVCVCTVCIYLLNYYVLSCSSIQHLLHVLHVCHLSYRQRILNIKPLSKKKDTET